MIRDMDLARDILFTLESAEYPLSLDKLCTLLDDNRAEIVAFHVDLLKAQGLVESTLSLAKDGDSLFAGGKIQGLTFDGCDYLYAIRDRRTWKTTKQVIAKSVGCATFATIKRAAEDVAMSLISKELA